MSEWNRVLLFLSRASDKSPSHKQVIKIMIIEKEEEGRQIFVERRRAHDAFLKEEEDEGERERRRRREKKRAREAKINCFLPDSSRLCLFAAGAPDAWTFCREKREGSEEHARREREKEMRRQRFERRWRQPSGLGTT